MAENQDLSGNNIQGAAEEALALLQCSYHFQQQAALIDNLVGWAFYSESVEKIRDMIVDDIRASQARNDRQHVRNLLHVFHHFLRTHPEAKPQKHTWSGHF